MYLFSKNIESLIQFHMSDVRWLENTMPQVKHTFWLNPGRVISSHCTAWLRGPIKDYILQENPEVKVMKFSFKRKHSWNPRQFSVKMKDLTKNHPKPTLSVYSLCFLIMFHRFLQIIFNRFFSIFYIYHLFSSTLKHQIFQGLRSISASTSDRRMARNPLHGGRWPAEIGFR